VGITELQRTPNLSVYKHLPRGGRVNVSSPGPVTLGHADFPIWQVVHRGKVIPHTGPLISFNAPEAGIYSVERRLTGPELIGWLTSLFAGMALLAVHLRRRKPSPAKDLQLNPA